MLSMSDALTYKINHQVGVSNVTTQGRYEVNNYLSGFSLPRITLTQLAISVDDENIVGWPTDSQDVLVDVVPSEDTLQIPIFSQVASLAYTNNSLRSTGIEGARTLRNIHVQYNGSATEGTNKLCLTTAKVHINISEYNVGSYSGANTYSRIETYDETILENIGGDNCSISSVSISQSGDFKYSSAMDFLDDISANNDTLDDILSEVFYASCMTEGISTKSILQVRRMYSSTGMGRSQGVYFDIITLNQTRQVYCDSVAPELVKRQSIYSNSDPGYIVSGVNTTLLSLYTDTDDSDNDILEVSGVKNFVRYQDVTTTATTYYDIKAQVISLVCLAGAAVLLKVFLVFRTKNKPTLIDVVKEVVMDGYCYVNPFTVFTKKYDLRKIGRGAYYDESKKINHYGIVYKDTSYEPPRPNVPWGKRSGA